jgi:hypothetical protein
MDLLQKKKPDTAGEITGVIMPSWQLFNLCGSIARNLPR